MKTRFIPLMIFILFTACTAPQNPDPAPAPVFTAIPTLTIPPSTPTYAVSPLDDAENTVYYFAPNVCSAKWANNGQELPCPGITGQFSSGYVDLLTQTELNLPYKANALLTLPSQDGIFLDIFGTYPPMNIQLNDFFRALLYCMPKSQCDVTFSLGYYDSSEKFYEPFPAWPYNYTELPRLVNIPLDILAGQTVQLTLIVRDNGDPADDFAIWVEPRIFRHSGTPAPLP